MNEKLRECPFCGGEVEIFVPEKGFFRICCKTAFCDLGYPEAWYNDKIKLIKDWNTRHEPKHETVETIISRANGLIDYVILKSNRKEENFIENIICLSLYLRDEIAIHLGKSEGRNS